MKIKYEFTQLIIDMITIKTMIKGNVNTNPIWSIWEGGYLG